MKKLKQILEQIVLNWVKKIEQRPLTFFYRLCLVFFFCLVLLAYAYMDWQDLEASHRFIARLFHAYVEEVGHLNQQVSSQEATIADLRQNLAEKNEEVEKLLSRLKATRGVLEGCQDLAQIVGKINNLSLDEAKDFIKELQEWIKRGGGN